MIGLKKGSWTVIAADSFHPRRWVARCKCGTERSFPEHRLNNPKNLSCVCQGTCGGNRSTHGMSYTPIYAVWNSMKVRCGNPNFAAYDRYGGRGIKVCERWQIFDNFLTDMGPTYLPGLTIERENNDGNYEPGNCHWATITEQNRNHSSNVWIDTCRGRMLMQDAARIAGLTWRGMWYRVSVGKTGEELFAPAKVKRRAA